MTIVFSDIGLKNKDSSTALRMTIVFSDTGLKSKDYSATLRMTIKNKA